MVLEIIVGAILFSIFMYDYFMEADRVPVVYPILGTNQANAEADRKPLKKRLLEFFGFETWRGLRVSLSKKLALPNWLRLQRPEWLRHSSGGRNSRSSTKQLPPLPSSSSAPPRKIYANDKELNVAMTGAPGVFKKSSSMPEVKRPKWLKMY